MSLTQRVQQDFYRLSTDKNQWAVDIKFLGKKDDLLPEAKIVAGFHNKHHTGYSELGERISTRNSSIAVSEQALTEIVDGAFNIRKTPGGDLDMLEHVIQVANSTGEERTYIITKNFPDEVIGCLVFILSDYAIT